jgi:hypothetical protein
LSSLLEENERENDNNDTVIQFAGGAMFPLNDFMSGAFLLPFFESASLALASSALTFSCRVLICACASAEPASGVVSHPVIVAAKTNAENEAVAKLSLVAPDENRMG